MEGIDMAEFTITAKVDKALYDDEVARDVYVRVLIDNVGDRNVRWTEEPKVKWTKFLMFPGEVWIVRISGEAEAVI
jgi:hypothetical protein